ncbi:MAG: amidohydrolase family protein [Candidatus Poribacteria bacterium]|nr:amidohydrolase family protein [Candidatus Poribacteria bacterium]MDP6745756.1 amidohydrolase family protein [Candidatus Poribacteria bacterium]MDP6996119.1 amidohydrolase family protein [Candidatus Poribacteria bacterium]
MGVPLEDTLTMATLTAAENLKVDTTKRAIEIGKDADLVILTLDLTVHAILISGQSVLL